jgi:hypothetical protein
MRKYHSGMQSNTATFTSFVDTSKNGTIERKNNGERNKEDPQPFIRQLYDYLYDMIIMQ